MDPGRSQGMGLVKTHQVQYDASVLGAWLTIGQRMNDGMEIGVDTGGTFTDFVCRKAGSTSGF
ncbi:hypothetical protein C2W62_39925 [Candidatus Entotheonella serta]|nr:hypothetical protein C2W62_39925 [Candidatus Entotheonella serta]